jgi:xylulokinase
MREAMALGEVRVSGGGANSRLWIQIIADVLDMPVRVVGTPESAAHGAALLAATGKGAFGSVREACDAAVEVGPLIEPGAAVQAYAGAYPVYRSLYPTLRQTFGTLSRLEG